MSEEYDIYDEEEELRDTIRAYLEGRLNYFDYTQTLMMLGKSEADVKEEVERIRAEIDSEKKVSKPKEEPQEEEETQDQDIQEEPLDDGSDEGDSEDYTEDGIDYEDDMEDYTSELIEDGHMGVRATTEDDQDPGNEVEDYGIGVDPEELESTPASEAEDGPGEEVEDEKPEGEGPAEEEDAEEGSSEREKPKDDGIEDFIDKVYEDDESPDAPKPKKRSSASIGGIFDKLPKKPVRRHPKESSEDDPGDGTKGKNKKKAKQYDPDSLMGKIDRWYKITFQNYVKLRTLSRNDDTGEFRMDLDLIKRKDLPRMAVAVTGENHTYAVDKIKRTEWYYMNHDKSKIPPWEAQFTASDAALFMMSDKLDNALTINWTQQSNPLAENKKIILLAALGILAIVLFFLMRH